MTGSAQVSLLRWLRRQLRQPEPLREHLEAAVGANDVAEAKRIVARYDFSAAQRHHVDLLLDEWQSELDWQSKLESGAAPDDLDAPGLP